MLPAVQSANNEKNYRHGNFGGSLVCNMFLTYAPDGTNVYGSRGEKFEGIGWLKVVKPCS